MFKPRLPLNLLATPLVLLAATSAMAQGSAKIGEWHLDLARSSFGGTIPPKEDVRIYEDAGDGRIRSIHRTVNADGSRSVTIYVARDDGRSYPLTDEQGRVTGSISLTPNGPEAQDFTTIRGGRVVASGNTSISADGHVLTMALQLGDPAAPKKVTAIFIKQPER